MPGIVAVGLGRPDGYYPQRRVFDALGHREIWWPVFEGARIAGRPLYSPPEEAFSRSPQEQQDAYAEAALSLSRQAILGALEAGGTKPSEVGCFAFASCTGVPLCPSFPLVLAGELGFPPDCLFLPLHGIGCQGSGPALRVAWDWLRLNPLGKAVVVACEISSAAYHPKTTDNSQPNKGVYLGNSIFGDGVGCVLLSGMGKGLSLLDFLHRTEFQHRQEIGMAWVEGRYRLVLSTKVPDLVAPLARDTVLALLKKASLSPSEVSYVILHSGGSQIISNVQRLMGLTDQQVKLSWETWQEVGNLSSATILFTLEKLFANPPPAGSYVVVATLGAGIECDAILGVWNE